MSIYHWYNYKKSCLRFITYTSKIRATILIATIILLFIISVLHVRLYNFIYIISNFSKSYYQHESDSMISPGRYILCFYSRFYASHNHLWRMQHYHFNTLWPHDPTCTASRRKTSAVIIHTTRSGGFFYATGTHNETNSVQKKMRCVVRRRAIPLLSVSVWIPPPVPRVLNLVYP